MRAWTSRLAAAALVTAATVMGPMVAEAGLASGIGARAAELRYQRYYGAQRPLSSTYYNPYSGAGVNPYGYQYPSAYPPGYNYMWGQGVNPYGSGLDTWRYYLGY